MTWELLGALASVVTALIAILVFIEARKIRHTEWLSRSVQLWQGFNHTVLETGHAELWRKFVAGELSADDLGASDHYILFSYVNIIFTEYQYRARRLIDGAYAARSIERNLRQLAPYRDELVPKLQATGYDPRFLALLADLGPDCAIVDPDSRVTNRVRALLGRPSRLTVRAGPPGAGHH